MKVGSSLIGHTRWFFPDGELPPHGGREPHGHESLVMLNPNSSPAGVKITIYFADRPPTKDLQVEVGAERVRCVRLDEPVGEQKIRIPVGQQYALMLEGTVPIIAQIGRMDVQQPNLAYYTVMGFPC